MEPNSPPLQPEEFDKRNTVAEERTKLAAERTFLAWIRTGMTSMGIGIAIARFIIFRQIEHQQIGHLIGQLLILWGISIFVLALISYSRSVRRFKPALMGPPFAGLTIVTILLIIFSLILFWIVVE
jgi:putative membrane protein